MPARTRRRYTEEFKREAVRLVRESAHPVAQVARDLGISDNVLYRWTAQHWQAAAHGTTRVAQRAEDRFDILAPTFWAATVLLVKLVLSLPHAMAFDVSVWH